MIRLASTLAFACLLFSGAAHAQISNADLLTRIDRLEAALRDLTGSVEQLQYRNQQLEQEIQRLQAAAPVAAAPRPPVQNSPPAAAQYSPPPAQSSPVVASGAPVAPSEPASQPGRHGDAFDPALNPNAPGAPRTLGAPGIAAAEPPPPVSDAPIAAPGPRQIGAPLDLSSVSAPQGGAALGTALPAPPPANPSATGAMQATLPPSNTPKDEYDLGYGYVLHKDYGPAADTFRDFLHKYPSDRLAPEAQYWLGESLFQAQQYRDAAEAFLAVSTKYETTARAPDALLRLGQSLAALGEKEAACASLGEVLRKYPRASLSVKQSVDREQKRVHC
ncbi:MAG TPA: tol-pal system protein YbgF [Xanthobacteraceae bacterium]|nr:tol-pal system protein YbgF [Xanthobacteraceae bacterium]